MYYDDVLKNKFRKAATTGKKEVRQKAAVAGQEDIIPLAVLFGDLECPQRQMSFDDLAESLRELTGSKEYGINAVMVNKHIPVVCIQSYAGIAAKGGLHHWKFIVPTIMTNGKVGVKYLANGHMRTIALVDPIKFVRIKSDNSIIRTLDIWLLDSSGRHDANVKDNDSRNCFTIFTNTKEDKTDKVYFTEYEYYFPPMIDGLPPRAVLSDFLARNGDPYAQLSRPSVAGAISDGFINIMDPKMKTPRLSLEEYEERSDERKNILADVSLGLRTDAERKAAEAHELEERRKKEFQKMHQTPTRISMENGTTLITSTITPKEPTTQLRKPVHQLTTPDSSKEVHTIYGGRGGKFVYDMAPPPKPKKEAKPDTEKKKKSPKTKALSTQTEPKSVGGYTSRIREYRDFVDVFEDIYEAKSQQNYKSPLITDPAERDHKDRIAEMFFSESLELDRSTCGFRYGICNDKIELRDIFKRKEISLIRHEGFAPGRIIYAMRDRSKSDYNNTLWTFIVWAQSNDISNVSIIGSGAFDPDKYHLERNLVIQKCRLDECDIKATHYVRDATGQSIDVPCDAKKDEFTIELRDSVNRGKLSIIFRYLLGEYKYDKYPYCAVYDRFPCEEATDAKIALEEFMATKYYTDIKFMNPLPIRR